jgi:hypothetical protein
LNATAEAKKTDHITAITPIVGVDSLVLVDDDARNIA